MCCTTLRLTHGYEALTDNAFVCDENYDISVIACNGKGQFCNVQGYMLSRGFGGSTVPSCTVVVEAVP